MPHDIDTGYYHGMFGFVKDGKLASAKFMEEFFYNQFPEKMSVLRFCMGCQLSKKG